MTDDSIVARMREHLSATVRTPDSMVDDEETYARMRENQANGRPAITPEELTTVESTDPYAGIRTRPTMGGRMAGRRSEIEDVVARREQADEEFRRLREQMLNVSRGQGGSSGRADPMSCPNCHTTMVPVQHVNGMSCPQCGTSIDDWTFIDDWSRYRPPGVVGDNSGPRLAQPEPPPPPAPRPLNTSLNRSAKAHMDEMFADLDTRSRGELLDLIALMREDWRKLNEIHNERANRSSWCTEYEERQERHNQGFKALKLMGRTEGGGSNGSPL